MGKKELFWSFFVLYLFGILPLLMLAIHFHFI